MLPTVRLDRWDPDEAATDLVRRYVTSYGPVTLADVAWWTGFTKRRSAEALASLGRGMEEVSVDGWPGPLYRCGDEPPATPSGTVAALPVLDPYVQGYRDRERLVPVARQEYVWDGGGNAAATIVLDGRIVGVWQATEEPRPMVRYHLFEQIGSDAEHAAVNRLAEAGRLYFDHEVEVTEVDTMSSLRSGRGRSAAHPLDGRPHRSSRRSG